MRLLIGDDQMLGFHRFQGLQKIYQATSKLKILMSSGHPEMTYGFLALSRRFPIRAERGLTVVLSQIRIPYPQPILQNDPIPTS